MINSIDKDLKKIECLGPNLYHCENNGKFKILFWDHVDFNFDYYKLVYFLDKTLEIVEVEEIQVLSINIDGILEEEIEVPKLNDDLVPPL